MDRAAPGLRPRRGSQLRRRQRLGVVPLQRRDFGPGEDHNVDDAAGAFGDFTQRRDFGPGEDHNTYNEPVPKQAYVQRRDFGPGEDHNYAWAAWMKYLDGQRRDFGPGEDHNMLKLVSVIVAPPADPGLRPVRGRGPAHVPRR